MFSINACSSAVLRELVAAPLVPVASPMLLHNKKEMVRVNKGVIL